MFWTHIESALKINLKPEIAGVGLAVRVDGCATRGKPKVGETNAMLLGGEDRGMTV